MDILLNSVANSAATLSSQHYQRPPMFLASSLDQHQPFSGGHFLGDLDELEAQQNVRNSDSPMGGFDADSLLASALAAAVSNGCAPSSASSSASISSSCCSTTGRQRQQPTIVDGTCGKQNAATMANWSRSAGRKKSHPVWAFFHDLRDSNGVGGVSCLHCDWTGDDRSPNNLRTHLKRFHEADGVFKQFTQELALTPTQPYVKRKRQQQPQGQQKSGDSQTQQSIVDQQPQAEHPATILKQQVKEEKKSPSPPAAHNQIPAASIVSPNSQLADMPHSGPQSAFSKYSTAALLQGQEAGGKKSPAHGEEAPKQQRQSAALPLAATGGQMTTTAPSAARPNYGMEAMQGLNGQQLAMLGMSDQSLMAQLDTMNQLVQLQQQSEKMQQQQQQPLNGQRGMAVGQQPSLNDLLALYAASALQQQKQQQDGLKANAAGQQQQLAAQQAAAATAWLYNWEWMVAAQRMQQQGNAGANYGMLAGLPAAQLQQQQQKGAQLNGQQAAAMAAALGLAGGFNGSLTNGTAATQRTKSQQQQQQQSADTMLARAAMSQLLIQAQQQQQQQPKQQSQPTVATTKVEPTAAKQPKAESASQQSQAQKRKSPSATATVPSSNSDECAAASLLVLADTAASTAAVERRMRDQRENAESGSPTKQARRDPTPQQQQQQQAENEKALAESLVLYGMHRIAMELQLSYSVHATRQGRAEYAFYSATGAGNGTASTQQMVTLTETADQILHLREIANGAVVTEEHWPKSAEPCSLLHSLKDKCQRRLCSAQ